MFLNKAVGLVTGRLVDRITMLVSFLASCLLTSSVSLAQQSTNALDFGPVNFASYNNYVYRDNTTSGQVVISE